VKTIAEGITRLRGKKRGVRLGDSVVIPVTYLKLLYEAIQKVQQEVEIPYSKSVFILDMNLRYKDHMWIGFGVRMQRPRSNSPM